jgi:hypothetical protein
MQEVFAVRYRGISDSWVELFSDKEDAVFFAWDYATQQAFRPEDVETGKCSSLCCYHVEWHEYKICVESKTIDSDAADIRRKRIALAGRLRSGYIANLQRADYGIKETLVSFDGSDNPKTAWEVEVTREEERVAVRAKDRDAAWDLVVTLFPVARGDVS